MGADYVNAGFINERKIPSNARSSCYERVGQAQRTHRLQVRHGEADPPPAGLATEGPNSFKNDGSWGPLCQRWFYQWAHNLKQGTLEYLRVLCGITRSAP